MAEARTVTVPIVIKQDEDGVWCARAQLRPGVGSHGEGEAEEAVLETRHGGNRDIPRGTLQGILSDIGMTIAELAM